MFCPNCGAQLPDNAAFCMKCGYKIPTVSEPTQAAFEEQPAGFEPVQPVDTFEQSFAQTAAPAQPSYSFDQPAAFEAAPKKVKKTNIAMGIFVSMLFIVLGVLNIAGALTAYSGAALSWVYIICYFSIAVLVFIARGKLVLFPMGIITVLDLFSWFGSLGRIGSLQGVLSAVSGFFGVSAFILMTMMCVYLLADKPLVPSKGFLKLVPFICQLNAFIFRVLWFVAALGAPFRAITRSLINPLLLVFVALFVPLWIRKPQKNA